PLPPAPPPVRSRQNPRTRSQPATSPPATVPAASVLHPSIASPNLPAHRRLVDLNLHAGRDRSSTKTELAYSTTAAESITQEISKCSFYEKQWVTGVRAGYGSLKYSR